MPHTHDIEMRGDVVRKTYVSWSDDEPGREWSALVLLDEHAPLAPQPIARLAVDGRPAITMSRVDGETLSGRLSARQTSALTASLLRLFAVPVPAGLPVRANGPAVLRETTVAHLADSHDWDRCQDPALVRHAASRALDWLVHHPVPPGWRVDPVVSVGDGNVDNVLWDGTTCRLLDWEEFGVSDRAFELADLVEHASSRLGGLLDVEALLHDLVPDQAQRRRVEQHRRLLACFWLAKLLPGHGGWHRNPPGSTEARASHATGLLDLGP